MKTLTEQEINELLELQKEVKQGLRPKLPCAEDEAIFYITDSGEIVTRFARNFKIMGSLGIEIEATAWERNKENPNALELHTTIIHSGEFGKRAFLTKAEAEEGVAELARQRLAQED